MKKSVRFSPEVQERPVRMVAQSIRSCSRMLGASLAKRLAPVMKNESIAPFHIDPASSALGKLCSGLKRPIGFVTPRGQPNQEGFSAGAAQGLMLAAGRG